MEQYKIKMNSHIKSVSGEHRGQVFRISSVADNGSIIEAINIKGE